MVGIEISSGAVIAFRFRGIRFHWTREKRVVLAAAMTANVD